jgi:putative transposon-encoded protein
LTLTLADGAAAQPSTTQWVAGEFRPYNTGANDAFVAPAPAGPYTNAAPAAADTLVSVFGSNGTNLNGTWTLYVVDDAAGDLGTMAGWKLTFEANDYLCSVGSGVRSRADFDGDGKTDLSVFRPAEGNWYLNQSTAGFGAIKWGVTGDTLVPGDYDSDGKTDVAVFRPNADPAQPDYFILRSNGNTVSGVSWGLSADQPLVGGDYDNDGKTDVAVYRPSNNTFYILNSGGGPITVKQYGVSGDVPIAGDWVGSNATDIAVFRSSTNTYWIFNGVNDTVVPFGAAGDVPVPADYNNDNKTDFAVYRPSTGQWIYNPSGGGATVFRTWGVSTDTPVPGDYDGDGSDDIAIYRPTTGQWWINRSTSGVLVQTFGLPTDIAVPRRYLP